MATDEAFKKDIYKRFSALDKRLDRVLYILESDPKTNEKGLVETVNSIKKYVDVIKLEKAEEKGKATVWGFVGGFIVTTVIWVGKILITKEIG